MISPSEIRQKAETKYFDFLDAFLANNPTSFFPCTIRCSKKHDNNVAKAKGAYDLLIQQSKAKKGFGYSVRVGEKRSRSFGSPPEVKTISFDTEHDFLTFIDKSQEFESFSKAVHRVKAEFPAGQLDEWILHHKATFIKVADVIDVLLSAVSCIQRQQHLDRFARELPIDAETKFVEQHEAVLIQWLDRILEPHAIRADEDHFARRFGLMYEQPKLLVRLLDPNLAAANGALSTEYSIALNDLAQRPIPATHVVIVENQIPLRRLPTLTRTLALGGMGNAAVLFRYLEWIRPLQILYWGDLDVEGFQILSRLRMIFDNVRSVMMDEETLLELRKSVGGIGNGRPPKIPANLMPEEAAAFIACSNENLRIEQEKISREHVALAFERAYLATTRA